MAIRIRFWNKIDFVFLSIAIILGLYFRISNPWDAVFRDYGVMLSGNDPWYYQRLIENCFYNFPQRIWFDPFTHYPYGTYTPFGPFLVYLVTLSSKILGLSIPSLKTVSVFIPVVGGALIALPVYLFARETFNRSTAIIAAFLVIAIPGQLLHRSVLSFNDHHIWEAFWQISVLGFFALAYNRLTSENPNNQDLGLLEKRNLLYPVLAGVALGMYLDAWAPGFIISIYIFAFIFISTTLKFIFNVDVKKLVLVFILMSLTATLVYLPFAFNHPTLSTNRYNPLPVLILLSLSLISIVLFFLSRLEERGHLRSLKIKEEYSFGAIVMLLAVLLVGLLTLIPSDLTQIFFSVLRVIQPKGGALTVAEVQPFFIQYGEFSLANAWFNFSMTFFFAIPGMLYATYLLFRQRKPLHLLVLVWGFAMLVALAGQNRFAYYFGVVSAVFAAVMLDAALRYFKFYDLIAAAVSKENALKKVGYIKPIIAVLLIVILFYPTLADANFQSKYSAGGINRQWYDALVWMRNNTPGKEMYDQFYYELYKPNPDLKKPYPYYPEGTYGVMSWWDYGHWITAIAHRMPNANPFQQGIGNKYNNVPGAAPFFTAYNESEANAIADKLGVKYVISDVEMATGKFQAMAVWAEGDFTGSKAYYLKNPAPDPSFRDEYMWYVYISSDGRLGIAKNRYELPRNTIRAFEMYIPSINYFRTMEAKLHIMDGIGLKRYRMVYESGFESKRGLTIEILYRYIYDTSYAKEDFVPVMSTGYVKIFEYVKGAKITGKVDGSVEEVVISANITTNQNRTFVYMQVSEVVDGKYEFIVPYAQETVYPVKASEYRITAGNESKRVPRLSDADVEGGKVVVVDFV